MKTPIVDSKYIDIDIIKKRFHMGSRWEHENVEEFINKYGKDTYDRIKREEMIKIDLNLRQDLIKQYMCLDIDKIFEKYGEEKVISFINKISKYYVNEIFPGGFDYSVGDYGKLPYETKKKFYDLSLNVDMQLKEKYSIEDFFKLCRVCFDAAPKQIFIDEASDYYVYSNENDFKITDDFRILSAITDTENVGVIKEPDLFHSVKEFSYKRYSDEKETFQVKGSSFCIVKHNKAPYEFDINKWNVRDLTRGILMYIGLREKGYNLSVDAVEVLTKYERYSLEH